ncbi:MAG: hypothetical protein NC131_04440 [Roseburia sp.]|nr:hypothetical protein [Roseburia sp.]
MKKKLIFFVAVLIVSLCMSASCKSENGIDKYHAEIYSSAEEWVNDNFLKENRVKAYYRNENYAEGVSLPSEKYIYEENSPSSRVFAITDGEYFGSVFSYYPDGVDFGNEIILLYVFGDTYPNRKYFLSDIILKDNVLNVYVQLENKPVKDATAPYQRCLTVKLDKLEFAEAIFISN